MVGYTEVLQTMAAMIIFSMILLNANRMILRNSVMQVEGELEQEVVALAQDIIEEARTKDFDQVTVGSGAAALPADIPGDFTPAASLGEDGETSRENYNDFDDYADWEQIIETEHGEFKVWANVFYVDPVTFDSTTAYSTFKKMKVYITSKFLTENNSNTRTVYHLEFIRNYYAD